jgi:hypothetical protein
LLRAATELLLQSGPQILSLPVDGGRAELAGGTLADYLERGGWIAWGAVPTDRPVGSTVDRLWRQLSLLWCDLVGAGCDPARLRTQALITPACWARNGLPWLRQPKQVMELRRASPSGCTIKPSVPASPSAPAPFFTNLQSRKRAITLALQVRVEGAGTMPPWRRRILPNAPKSYAPPSVITTRSTSTRTPEIPDADADLLARELRASRTSSLI